MLDCLRRLWADFNSRSCVRSDSEYVQNRIEKSYLLCENSQI